MVLVRPGGAGTKIALQRSQSKPQEHPRLDVADSADLSARMPDSYLIAAS